MGKKGRDSTESKSRSAAKDSKYDSESKSAHKKEKTVDQNSSSTAKSSSSRAAKRPKSSATRVVNDQVRLHVEVHQAHSAPAKNGGYVQWSQPYVTGTLLPFQWSQSTKKCPTSGCEPIWSIEQDNHLYFTPKTGSLGKSAQIVNVGIIIITRLSL